MFVLSYTQTHSDAVCIICGCFFIVVLKETTVLKMVNLFWEQVDKLTVALFGTVRGHTVSVFP